MKKLLLLTIMLVLSNVSFAQVALANESFEGVTFPPTGWTVTNTNATNNWTVDQGSAYVPYSEEIQDESLITPSFSLVGYTSAFLNVELYLSYDYMVTEPAGDLLIKVSKDNGQTWTKIWVEEDYGVFESFEALSLNLDLSAYVGESNVKIRFQYDAENADDVYVDNVSVTGCTPVSNVGISEISDQSATLVWLDTSDNYDIQSGPSGFEFGSLPNKNVTDPSIIISDLEEESDYDFYIRANCGGTSNSGWQGPFSFTTDLSSPTDLDYSFDFETTRFGLAGWSAPDSPIADSDKWTIVELDPASVSLAQDGITIAASFGTEGIATNATLYSRGLNLVGGSTVTVKYYVREFKFEGNGGDNNLEVRVGTDKTISSQSIIISPITNIGAATADEDAYVLISNTFIVPESGIYYLSFIHTSGAQTAADNGALLLDAVSVSTTPLSTENFFSSTFAVYPSPAGDVISVSNKNNISVNSVTITDLNGRVVKQSKYNNVSNIQINVSDLSAGMYMMNINTEKGIATKKVLKK